MQTPSVARPGTKWVAGGGVAVAASRARRLAGHESGSVPDTNDLDRPDSEIIPAGISAS
jgi:hypothetical protein